MRPANVSHTMLPVTAMPSNRRWTCSVGSNGDRTDGDKTGTVAEVAVVVAVEVTGEEVFGWEVTGKVAGEVAGEEVAVEEEEEEVSLAGAGGEGGRGAYESPVIGPFLLGVGAALLAALAALVAFTWGWGATGGGGYVVLDWICRIFNPMGANCSFFN